MADDLEGLDEAALNARLKAAETYDDRAAIRKALRDLKKSKGIDGAAKKRGTSQYNRFAGRTTAEAKGPIKQSFVPSSAPKTRTSSSSSSPVQSISTPTPPPTPPIDKEQEREEKEREERERRERLREEKERKEREREEKEREERENREREREERERAEEERRERHRQEKEQRERERQEREREEKERREREREERERERQDRLRQEKERKEQEKREREEREEREREEREREEREREENEVGTGQDEEENEESEEIEKDKDEWIMVDKKAAQEMEKKVQVETDDTDGRETEFQKLKLRKSEGGTPSNAGKTRSATVNTHDFGVKLKPRTQSDVTSAPPVAAKPTSKSTATPTSRPGGGGAPKTLADFQKLASRGKQSPGAQTTPSGIPKDKRTLIRMYINAALEVRPPISSDHALYQLCSKPSNLCKLINKSVRQTVDLRALTKTPPPSASAAEKAEALEENMILVVESARAIGCSVTENMEVELARGDHSAIDRLVLELIKSRVVHMPGMEDEPSSSFDDLSVLMSKLGLVATETDEPDDGGRGGEGDSEAGTSTSWRDVSSSGSSSSARTERGRGRHDDDHPPHSVDSTWREERNKKTPEIDLSKPSLDANLSYEERAAIRRAERERKRKEREALAVPK